MKKREERLLINSVENGEWKQVADFAAMKKKLMQAASETALKTKALEEGIPYQTLVTSVLHKYVTGRLVEGN